MANRAYVERSTICGCFHCLATYAPTEVKECVEDDDGDTAICPRCCVDSVLPDAAGLELSDRFLSAMHSLWFGT